MSSSGARESVPTTNERDIGRPSATTPSPPHPTMSDRSEPTVWPATGQQLSYYPWVYAPPTITPEQYRQWVPGPPRLGGKPLMSPQMSQQSSIPFHPYMLTHPAVSARSSMSQKRLVGPQPPYQPRAHLPPYAPSFAASNESQQVFVGQQPQYFPRAYGTPTVTPNMSQQPVASRQRACSNRRKVACEPQLRRLCRVRHRISI